MSDSDATIASLLEERVALSSEIQRLQAENARLREYGCGIIEAGADVTRELEAALAERDAQRTLCDQLRELCGELLKAYAKAHNLELGEDVPVFGARARQLGIPGVP